ncbi:MAG: co-chaperone GroES [Eubacterium sp.]|nr:co-chaperone GroES [Eubacterium sp.]
MKAYLEFNVLYKILIGLVIGAIAGIILAASAQEKPEISEVVAVGEGTEEHPMTVKVGDKVIISKYSGTQVKLDGIEYTISEVKDILAVVE